MGFGTLNEDYKNSIGTGNIFVRDSAIAKSAQDIHNNKVSGGEKYHRGDWYTGQSASAYHRTAIARDIANVRKKRG